jgi:hypothetical protein
MPLHLHDLDPRTRVFMRAEVDLDLGRGALYLSSRLPNAGRVAYMPALLDAIARGDDRTFAESMARTGYWNSHRLRWSRTKRVEWTSS